jgi:hypothetical protein
MAFTGAAGTGEGKNQDLEKKMGKVNFSHSASQIIILIISFSSYCSWLVFDQRPHHLN